MGGFFGWFLVLVFVLAIFNAEKLPAYRQLLEEKFKDGVDAAKEGSQKAKTKIKQVQKDIEEKKKNTDKKEDAEENTPEEIAESMQFMGAYVKQAEDKVMQKNESPKQKDEDKTTPQETDAEKTAEGPVDLEHNYK